MRRRANTPKKREPPLVSYPNGSREAEEEKNEEQRRNRGSHDSHGNWSSLFSLRRLLELLPTPILRRGHAHYEPVESQTIFNQVPEEEDHHEPKRRVPDCKASPPRPPPPPLLEGESQTINNQSHHEENPGSASAKRVDEAAIEIVGHCLSEKKEKKEKKEEEEIVGHSVSELSTSGSPQSLDTTEALLQSEWQTSLNRGFWKWLFVISNVSFEILASAFDQVSSPNKPGYALAGLVMSLVAVAVCVTEFLWKARMEKVTMGQWGPICWFYYPSSRGRLYGTFAEIFGIICAILQVIFSAIEYGLFLQHAENPIKISIFPVIFALCVSGSKLINNPNEGPREGHSEVVHRKKELEETGV